LTPWSGASDTDGVLSQPVPRGKLYQFSVTHQLNSSPCRYVAEKLSADLNTKARFVFCSVQLRMSAVNVPLPAFAVAAPLLLGTQRRAAIDWYILPVGCSAANPPHAAAAVNRWDRQTGRRTDTGPLYRPCSAYYASVPKISVSLL